MTVNLGLVTSDALVLGCDSVASTTEYFLDPYAIAWEKDASGNLIQDPNGMFMLKFLPANFRPVVTNAWGGVTKMFEIHPTPSPVVAITAGLAKLKDRTIASYAAEFLVQCEQRKPHKLVNVKTICEQFLTFMRRRYVAHYKGSPVLEQFREGPQFLVGGFGRDDAFPSLYRISVKDNVIVEEFVQGKSGISWSGQADAVERFIRGFDTAVRTHVEITTLGALRAQEQKTQTYITDLVNRILDLLGQKLPSGIEIKPPSLGKIDMDWKRFAVPIDYANLPLQEAVYLVSAMVMSQASKARFAVGVATVGGRTHIGVITKAEGFEILNEPVLTHRYTGFSDDN